MGRRNAFTLLEIILVVAVLGLITGFGMVSYSNYGKGMQLATTRKIIVNDLRHMRVKAAAGEERRAWGIHFVNGADDYYELFSTPTTYSDGSTTVLSTIYLPATVEFTTPAEGASLDVLFSSISATTAAQSIVLQSEDVSETLTITPSGTVY